MGKERKGEGARWRCLRQRGLRRCAMCPDYPCEKLNAEERQADSRRRKWLGLLALLLAVGAMALFCWLIGRPLLRYAQEPERFRLWVEQHRLSGPLVYMAMVLLQVLVALIPGEPLEILGGYAFGAVEGTVWCLLGASAGSAVVFALVRRFGMKLVNAFFSREQLSRLRFLQSSPKRNVLFMLVFMVPGTPKDLLCYFAGLTDIPWPVLMLVASVGRLPSVVTSTVGGNALGEESYGLAAAVFVAALVISLGGLALYQYLCKRQNSAERKKPLP